MKNIAYHSDESSETDEDVPNEELSSGNSPSLARNSPTARNSLMPRNSSMKSLGNSPSKESGNSLAPKKICSGTSPPFQKKLGNTHASTKKSRNAAASVSRS
ncbi:4090_t:CDS:2, partial [Gigaspora rosea]